MIMISPINNQKESRKPLLVSLGFFSISGNDRNAGSQLSPAAWFTYSPDRKDVHPQQHLSRYNSILQADAYGDYHALCEKGRITEAACMTHARWKIHEVHVHIPTDITTETLKRLGELKAVPIPPL